MQIILGVLLLCTMLAASARAEHSEPGPVREVATSRPSSITSQDPKVFLYSDKNEEAHLEVLAAEFAARQNEEALRILRGARSAVSKADLVKRIDELVKKLRTNPSAKVAKQTAAEQEEDFMAAFEGKPPVHGTMTAVAQYESQLAQEAALKALAEKSQSDFEAAKAALRKMDSVSDTKR